MTERPAVTHDPVVATYIVRLPKGQKLMPLFECGQCHATFATACDIVAHADRERETSR